MVFLAWRRQHEPVEAPVNETARNKWHHALFLGLVLLFSGLAVPSQAVYYIDASATGTPEDGSTWSNAFRTIPTAVTKATGEFWVAEGLYTNTAVMNLGTNNFYGGFTNGMTDLSQRDWVTHRTICDGQTIRQVFQKSVAGPTTLDGFIVRNGNVNGSGGAIYLNSSGLVTINNCVFSNNVSNRRGGAICLNNAGVILYSSNCHFIANSLTTDGTDGGGAIRGHSTNNIASFWDCTFVSNRSGGTASGGAINSGNGLFNLTRCTFKFNTSISAGGAISATVQLRALNCDFLYNTATNGGGGAINHASTVGTNIFQNCSFVGNSSTNAGNSSGGGAFCEAIKSFDTFLNCTFLANSATHTTNAAFAVGGAIKADATGMTLAFTNCIFWGNACSGTGTNLSDYSAAGVLTMSYCDVNTNAGWFSFISSTVRNYGLGITNTDPLFASASYPYDAHLKSMAGRWDPTLGLWVTDAVSSPCIDAGDPASDYSLEPANNGGQINLGRYGNTVYGSKSGAAARSKGAIIIIR